MRWCPITPETYRISKIVLNSTQSSGGCSILWGLQLHHCLWKKVFIFGPSSWPFETSMFLKVTKQTQNMFPGCTSGKERSPWNNPKRKLVFPAPFSEVLVAGSVTIQGHLLPFAAEQALTAALYAIELTCIWCPVAEANNCRAQGHFLSWSWTDSLKRSQSGQLESWLTSCRNISQTKKNFWIIYLIHPYLPFPILLGCRYLHSFLAKLPKRPRVFPSWLGRFRNSSGA